MKIDLAYNFGDEKCGYQGKIFRDGFEEFLTNRVNQRYYDVEGSEYFVKVFSKVKNADFGAEFLTNLATLRKKPTGWRIGESIAECYLEDYENVKLPYKSSRDDRNPNSNSQGADIIGFLISKEIIFIIGEIKTSRDKTKPPSVVYGNHGLIYQLTQLKTKREKRLDLIKWLGHKLEGLDNSDEIKQLYVAATNTYSQSLHTKIKLIGVLVRDTEPKENDLKNPYTTLTNDIHDEMQLKLLALHIPIKISDLATSIGANSFAD